MVLWGRPPDHPKLDWGKRLNMVEELSTQRGTYRPGVAAKPPKKRMEASNQQHPAAVKPHTHQTKSDHTPPRQFTRQQLSSHLHGGEHGNLKGTTREVPGSSRLSHREARQAKTDPLVCSFPRALPPFLPRTTYPLGRQNWRTKAKRQGRKKKDREKNGQSNVSRHYPPAVHLTSWIHPFIHPHFHECCPR